MSNGDFTPPTPEPPPLPLSPDFIASYLDLYAQVQANLVSLLTQVFVNGVDNGTLATLETAAQALADATPVGTTPSE